MQKCLLSLGLLLAGSAVSAQTPASPSLTAPPEEAAVAKSAVPAGYVIGVDDLLEVMVANHTALNERLTVLPDGKVSMAEAGDFQAAGKTAKQLAHDIEAVLLKTLNNCDVTVIVREVHSKKVKIVGAVRQAGSFDMRTNWRLMDLIALAGGLSSKPSRITGRILREDDKLTLIPLDVARAAKDLNSDANVLLQPGDLVELDEPTTRDEVYVIGQVNRPGPLPLDEQSSLLSVISEAGNPLMERAALTKAYILRNGKQIPINLRPILAQGKADTTVTDFKLQSGDVIMIPEIENRYAVMGNINKPGYYPIPEKGPINVYEALNIAGGQTDRGDLGRAGIIHTKDGVTSVTKVNLNDLMKNPKKAASITMQPEDVLFIPPRHSRGLVWQDVLAPFSIINLLGFRPFN